MFGLPIDIHAAIREKRGEAHKKMFKLAVYLTIGIAALQGSTIDSGIIVTPAEYISDDTAVFFRLVSTDGDFSVVGSALGGARVSYGNSLGCYVEFGYCPFGQTYSINAFFADDTFAKKSILQIDGSFFGSVYLDCPVPPTFGPICPHTDVVLTAAPVLIGAPGSYVVPFSATGRIQAAETCMIPSPCPFILDQPISGEGWLSFTVVPFSPGTFQFAFGPQALKWDFSVPEPSTMLATLLGLAAIQWRRHLRK